MQKQSLRTGSVLFISALLLSGCAFENAATRTDALRGKALYDERCVQCHGRNGEGAGAASLGLGLPPPSLRQLAQNNGGVFPTEFVMATIDGLSRHNEIAAAMPEFGAGDLGPIIQVEDAGLSAPIPADLIALASYLETIQD